MDWEKKKKKKKKKKKTLERHDKSDSHIWHHINSNEIDEHFEKSLWSEEGRTAETSSRTKTRVSGKKKEKMFITTDTIAQLRRLTSSELYVIFNAACTSSLIPKYRQTDGHGSWPNGFGYKADSHKNCKPGFFFMEIENKIFINYVN